ncbi:MAG: methyltransferase domain-containing protein [Nitriliruptorales bacterium]|nr:methyltransferase domain-containing protein [Nitriliruptorales bacterium]
MTSTETATSEAVPTQTDGEPPVDPDALRDEVKAKYREVAEQPDGDHHFHTGRKLAAHLGYPAEWTDDLPEFAIESFAGIANPFALRQLEPGERVVDVGSGAGFDSFVAAGLVGGDGYVVGVDMTAEMLTKSRRNAEELGLDNIEFCRGFAEELPVQDDWADVVISNGVINLCPDKRAVFEEISRVLRPGGVLQFGDIANGNNIPPGAMREIDLWTG